MNGVDRIKGCKMRKSSKKRRHKKKMRERNNIFKWRNKK